MYRRSQYQTLLTRMLEPRRFMQVLAGPRQVGKTTLALQVLEALELPQHYASADEPTLQPAAWLAQQWDRGRLLAREGAALLVLDEIQKLPGWSETVKTLWDEDSRSGPDLRLLPRGLWARRL